MPTRTISQTIDLTNKPINKYITEITGGGIKVHDSDDVLNYIQITSDGMEIFKMNGAESNPSAISIARFGEVVRIGKQDDNYFWIDTAGIYLKNKALSIFQIQAEAVNEGPDVNLKLYNKDGKTLGFYINKTTHNYHVQVINFSFDDASLTEGDTFTIKFNWSGRVVFKKKTSSTSYVARTYNEELYTHNFIYNTSATISHSREYDGSSQYSRQQIFRIDYDGKNNIKIVPTQNSFTDSDRMDSVRPYYFFNIVVFTSQQLSALPTVMIGPQEISHAEIDYHSFQMIDKNGNSFLHISDLQDINGYVTDTFIGDGTTVDFPLTFFCENTVDYIVTVDGVLNTDNHIYQGQGFYSFLEFYPNEQPSSNAEIIIKYKALDTYAYTFGTRDNSSVIGKFSTTIGENLKANTNHQVVIGKHNQIESFNWNFPEKNKVFIIGNGTSNNPSNALTVDWSGNLELAGSLKTNRDVLSDSKTISITATGQTLNFCSLTLPANSKFLILTTVYTNRGTNLTLINHITCTNNATMVGANTRVTTSSGQGVANWYYVVTNNSSSVATLHGYSYPDGGTGYNQTGSMVAIPL